MGVCSVFACNNNTRKKITPDTSFHKFPKGNQNCLKQWILFCKRKDPINIKTARICSLHFKNDDFVNNIKFEMGFTPLRLLNPEAVPSIDLKEPSVSNSAERSKRIGFQKKKEFLNTTDVTEARAVANDRKKNINTNAVDMLQEHEYTNQEGSDLVQEMNVVEHAYVLPETVKNEMNVDDPAITFVVKFLKEEEQVLDPMATNGADVCSAPRSSRKTSSQGPKKRGDIIAIENEEDDHSPDKQPINGQVIFPDNDQPVTVKSEDNRVNDYQCRVCTTTGELINLFKKEHTKTYAEKLMAICPTVNIQRKDFLPQFICEICVSSINAAFALKTQCEQTDAELRVRLEKSVKKVRQPIAVTYTAPDGDPEDFSYPPMDVNLKLSDATSPSADDSDSDIDKPFAKRRKRTRLRNRKTDASPEMPPLMTEKKSLPPGKKYVSTSPAKTVVKSEPGQNTSKSSEQDLQGSFSNLSEKNENYSLTKIKFY